MSLLARLATVSAGFRGEIADACPLRSDACSPMPVMSLLGACFRAPAEGETHEQPVDLARHLARWGVAQCAKNSPEPVKWPDNRLSAKSCRGSPTRASHGTRRWPEKAIYKENAYSVAPQSPTERTRANSLFCSPRAILLLPNCAAKRAEPRHSQEVCHIYINYLD